MAVTPARKDNNNSKASEVVVVGYVLFNEGLDTFYLQLYAVGQMIKDKWYARNPLPPLHGLLYD